MPPTSHRAVAGTDRGQTGIDFLVGAATFLLAVGFVFAFLPTMFDPFVATGTSNALIADRTAADLAEQRLAGPAQPGVLDEEATETFFADCDPDAIGDHLGVDTDRIHVEIAELNDVGESEVTPTCGDPPHAGASVTVSQRIVYAPWEGEAYTLYVEVW